MTLKINKIGIFGKPNNNNLFDIIEKIFVVVQNVNPKIQIYIDELTAKASSIENNNYISNIKINIGTIENLKNSIDLALVLGGDGTLLGIARQVASTGVYVLGINQGKVGFTTDLDVDDLCKNLTPLIKGEGIIEKRDMFDVSLLRKTKKAKKASSIFNAPAFNDAVVSRGAISRMVELDIFVNSVYLQTIRGDGLIVCTPTGSTAYALAVHGPIIHPKLEALALVPVAPQALSSRPILLPMDVETKIVIKNGSGTALHCDMQTIAELQDNDTILIKRSKFPVSLLHPNNYDYFSVLRRKLNWSSNPIRVGLPDPKLPK
jgi:NAD+ kinase